MTKEVQISHIECQNVYKLFTTYNAYLSILGYLAERKTLEENGMYDKKWDEAVALNTSLEEHKRKLEKKYKPDGEWDHFEFDFDKDLIIFTKDET